jgi:hypothetical protein
MSKPKISSDGRTITVRVPILLRKRGGRKLVLTPDRITKMEVSPRRRADDAMVKAIARAFRWREILENGTHATIAELALAEKITPSYVGRVLRLTLLAPHIIEAILDGGHPVPIALEKLFGPIPREWPTQDAWWKAATSV